MKLMSSAQREKGEQGEKGAPVLSQTPAWQRVLFRETEAALGGGTGSFGC